MKLRHDEVRENDSSNIERERERKDRWYNKLWDVTARMGKTLAKTLCVVSVPMLVASCSCGRIDLEGDTSTTPDATDVSHDDAQEADAGEEDATHEDVTHEDAVGDDVVEEDVLPEDVVEEDVPEEEVPAPCEDLLERSQVNNLIGDYLNRRLDDRLGNVPPGDAAYTDAAYPLENAETSDNANPFSDGIGGSLYSALAMPYFYRIGGDAFTPFASLEIVDMSAAASYYEEQNVWLHGLSMYMDGVDSVAGDINAIAYVTKFSNSSADFGIPVCSDPLDGDYTYCKSGMDGADYSYASELHKLRISFAGSDWLITEMSAPYGTAVPNEIQVQNGGYVKLGKEVMSGILNVGEAFPYDGYSFVLYDVEDFSGTLSAIISIEDAAGYELSRDRVSRGTTKYFMIGGETYMLHVWQVALGSMPGTRWADMSILGDELKIEDNMKLDPDNDRFEGWYGVVGWKNKGATVTGTQADHLRMFGFYSQNPGDVSSTGSDELLADDRIAIPENLTLCYGGLDVSDADRITVNFTFVRDANFDIAEVYSVEDSLNVACTIYAPYVRISSSGTFSSMHFGPTDGHEVYAAISGAHCGGSLGDVASGSLFMQFFGESNYGIHEYNSHDTRPGVGFTTLDHPEESPIAYISWHAPEDPIGNGDFIDPERPLNVDLEFIFEIYENARGTIWQTRDSVQFATDGNSFNLDLNYADTGESVLQADHIAYRAVGPVDIPGVFSPKEEGYITERGSVFASIDDTQVVYYVADRVAYSVFYIGLAEE